MKHKIFVDHLLGSGLGVLGRGVLGCGVLGRGVLGRGVSGPPPLPPVTLQKPQVFRQCLLRYVCQLDE